MAKHLDLGRKGESLAKAHLQNSGYTILDENWRYSRAEVDLVAAREKLIIFIEVKTRTGNGFGEPEDFVDARKQKLLVSAADEYIYRANHEGEVRFDIISVLFDKQNNYTLKHIEDAFWPHPDQ